jgi:hypothetical protein
VVHLSSPADSQGGGWRGWIATRKALRRLTVLFVVACAALAWAYFSMIRMPGRSFRGPLPALTASQAALADELRRDVDMLAGSIGRRNVVHSEGLAKSREFLEKQFREMGHVVHAQEFEVMGVACANLEVEVSGTTLPQEIVVIGAHYDSEGISPAANDNASGVAAALALARRFAPPAVAPARTLRFVLFVNEEPPYFQTDEMGSLVYARACRQRGDNVVAMLSLETIGYYSDAPGSQSYPVKPIGWLYPDTANFIAFVGDYHSRKLVRQAIGAFRSAVQFPSEAAAMPGWIAGVGWSDHWAFWQCGYPALMVTDTALFRYPHYHQASDTPDKIDYQRMARVVEGLEQVTRHLAQ